MDCAYRAENLTTWNQLQRIKQQSFGSTPCGWVALPEILEAATPFKTLDKLDFFSDVMVATLPVVAEGVVVVVCRAVWPAVLGSRITPEEWLMWLRRVCCFSVGRLVRTW